eukprot:CAMPEP_0177364844 /NCGR_PEP_ID=MMETSP0368-20130122/39000_1 /TAXON_ID=447022 ORGANISM="Scrippsiella hangoei-like, Strain SHHI-4" /NCGR_SAMPLE_ID=MMETSP0368 /ASSEMBLY_ACC=CAM_ASM_000363 /LENGTH=170 /DNA_ID=CAMNT_0018827719 /DNA_START=14 /DNA_END=526 /DNA_ORIENTATION=-
MAALFCCCTEEQGECEAGLHRRSVSGGGVQVGDVFQDDALLRQNRQSLGSSSKVQLVPIDEALNHLAASEGRLPERREDGKLLVRVAKDAHVRKIGLDICNHGNTALKIKRVKEGLVANHNKRWPGYSINAGDLILEVNGTSGDAEQLLSTIAMADSLDLVITTGDGSIT